jgi:hypothetical protein
MKAQSSRLKAESIREEGRGIQVRVASCGVQGARN